MATVTTGTFSATGQSSTVFVERASIGIDGGATATVVVQWQPIGVSGLDTSVWFDDYSFTADGSREVEFSEARNLRLNCTNYTSGTVTYAIVGVER